MAVVTTVRGTGTLDTETRRVRDVSPQIYKLEPNASPLLAFTTRFRASQTMDPKIEWFEDELLPKFDTLDSALGAGDATMSVKNQERFRAGDLVQIADAEIARVSATPSGTGVGAVSITRGVGTTYTTGQAAGANARVRIIAGSAQEGAAQRALLSTQKTPNFNYTQIFKMPFGVTRTAQYTKTFGGKDLLEEQANMLIEHKKEIEMAFLIGERYEDTTGTHPQRHTRGIIPFVAGNTAGVTSVAQLTESAFEEHNRKAFRYGSQEKLLMASSLVAQVVNAFGRGKLQTVSKDKSYGMSMSEWLGFGVRLMLVKHPLLENNVMTEIDGIASYGVTVDIGDFKLRYVGPKLTLLKENIQANDIDGRTDQYLSEAGLEAQLAKKHALLKDVQG